MNGNGQPMTALEGATMQQAAQDGMTSAPQAGSSPMSTPNGAVTGPAQVSGAPTAGGPVSVTQPPQSNTVNNSGQPQDPYSAFLQALQQIQTASPIPGISQTVPPAHKSAAAQQATMRETGVG